jgi:hypothetical protein
MWCCVCNHSVSECECPNIKERLAGLNQPGTNVYIAWCKKCDNAISRCTCKPEHDTVQ